MTDLPDPTTHHEEQEHQMTPAKNAAAPAVEPTEVHVDILPTLRVVQEGEAAPMPSDPVSTEELREHYVGLIVENERAAAELKAEAAAFTTAANEARAELLKTFPGKGKYTIGNLTATVTGPSRSFDAEAFMKAYPVEVNPALYKSVINTEAVPPNLKNQFMADGKGDLKVAVK